MRVLVVEDEPDLRRLLEQALREESYAVDVAADGKTGLYKATTWDYDAVILDLMLPGMSGWDVLSRLRATKKDVPVLILTARDNLADRVRGLDTGADDYIVKPFLMSELSARVRAVLRRIRPGLAEDRVRAGDIVIDRSAHRVKRAGRDVHLGPTEFRLLDYFMQHPGRVFSREQLLNAVWGSDVYVETR
ncbi:MAG TPA: response regulator, partial [Thermoanaerobaculia bacterium]|nr:response regulator [Thermoanaerobaculia bacterium]